MNMRLVDRSELACVLCGYREGHASTCPTLEWPPKLTPSLLATRILIVLCLPSCLLALVVKSVAWSLGLALFSLACGVGLALIEAFRAEPGRR